MDGLEEFFKKDDEQPAAEIETPQEPETQAAEEVTSEASTEEPKGPARDEKGRFAPKGETPETAQVESPATPEPTLDHAALIGERRRRQEAEERLRALEQQVQQYQQPAQQVNPYLGQTAQPQQTIPDRWEDPDGYDRYLIQQASQLAEERAMHAVQQQRIYESAVRARAKYEDYDAAHATFGDMAQTNPSLFQQMLVAPDPAEFAYQSAKREMEIRQYGSLDALIEARVQAALAQQATPAAPATAPIPETLADAQSSRGSVAAPTATPKPLSSFLGGHFV